MRVGLCWLVFLCSAPALAQQRLPILDMHLHAVPADHLGPPPRAMCTPMPSPAWDQRRAYGELHARLAKEPPCPDPVWSPMTDEEVMSQTIEVMERLDIVSGVLSEHDPEPVARWMAAAPGRFIPGLDPRMEPYWTLAEELDIPVAIHVGPRPPGAIYLGATGYRARLHSPLTMEEVLVRHPRLRVSLTHAGYPMLDNLLALLYAHPQV